MATTIKLKNSVTTTNAPSSLVQGEVAINITDKKVWVGNAATTPIQLLGDGASLNFTSLSLSGNLTFTGTGNRITGDFSNATVANRVAFQTSTTNGNTNITVIPNGTSTTTQLNLEGDASVTNGSLAQFINVGGSEVRIASGIRGSGTYLPLTMYTGGSERLRIDTSGNVGINLTPPTQFSTVRGLGLAGTNGNASYITSGGSQDLVLTSNAYLNNSGNFIYVNTDAVVQQRMTSGVVSWLSAASGTAGTTASLTERMRITSGGLVGVGTTSPQRKVSIVGTDGASGQTEGNSRTSLFLDNNGANYLSIFTSTSGDGGVFFSDNGSNNGGMVYETTNDALYFRANNAERMRITSGGVLLVNTTATNSNEIVRIKNGNDTRAIAFQSASSAECGYIYINAGGTSTTYSTSSDYRLKENIAPMTGALDKVAQLKPCTYTWKVNGSIGQGFIAHELQEFAPYAVSGEKDGKEMQGVDYGRITPLLTAALQEALAKIESLEARLAALESK